MASFSLTNGLFFRGDALEATSTDIHLDEAGRLLALGKKPDGFNPEQTIDLSGKWLIANLTDMSARLTLPERELHTALRHELGIAQTSGIAQVLMKPHQDHFVDHSDHLLQLYRTCANSAVEVGVCASLYRKQHNKDRRDNPGKDRFIDFRAMRDAGCREIDIPARTRYTPRAIEKAMIAAENLDMRLNLTALDSDLAGTGCCHEGVLSACLGLDGIPVTAETTSMLMHLELAAHTGCRLHLAQLTSAKAVEIFARARQDNPRISADVGISHLQFTDTDLAGFNSLLHTIPPLREAGDRKELIAAINHGIIECISSGHTPLLSSNKCNPFPGVTPGISTIETLIHQLLTLVEAGELNTGRAIAAISSQPDRLFHHDPGRKLETGCNIALTVVDAEKKRRWSLDDVNSAGKNSTVDGRLLHGQVVCIYNRGECLPVAGEP